jgi:hypothetical protein
MTAKLPMPPTLTPVQRLEQSRAHMRSWLDDRMPRSTASGAALRGGVLGEKLSEWLESLRSNPIAGAVIDGVTGWWSTHPLNSVFRIADETAGDMVGPLVRRHPLAVVAGAFVLGAIAIRIRPWRWLIRPALFAGLASQLTSRLVSHGPLDFMLGALHRFNERARATPPAAGPNAVPDPESHDLSTPPLPARKEKETVAS